MDFEGVAMVVWRWMQGAAGVVLLVAGLAAATVLAGPAAWGTPGDTLPPAAAQAAPDEHRAAMQQMMDAVHGPGTADRLDDVDGVDEMMDACAGMMAAMPMMTDGMGPGRMGPGMRRMMAPTG